jgi:hypothetical protein
MKWATITGICWCVMGGSSMLVGKSSATIRWITVQRCGPPSNYPGGPRFRLRHGPSMGRLRRNAAHYLHIVDTLEMAANFGMQVAPGADRTGGLRAAWNSILI